MTLRHHEYHSIDMHTNGMEGLICLCIVKSIQVMT